MRYRRYKWVLILCLMIMMSITMRANATTSREPESPELIKMRATAYLDTGNLTYTGKKGHLGIAGASKNHIGQTAIVYQRLPGDVLGEVIGIYEIEDTGPAEGASSGYVIDIWQPDMAGCQQFMNRVYEDGCGGKVFVQFFDDAEG